MTTPTQTIRFALDYARFAQACNLPRRAPQDIQEPLAVILQEAAKMTQWALKSCNGIMRRDMKTYELMACWDDEDEAAKEKSDTASMLIIRAEAAAIFGDVEYTIEFQGDPRGCPVKFIVGGREWSVDAGE